MQFGYKVWGKLPAQFHIATRALVLTPSSAGTHHAPKTTAPGLTFTKWKNTFTPTLNGTPLALKQYERSRALAIAPDEQTFLLGAEFYLRLRVSIKFDCLSRIAPTFFASGEIALTIKN